MRFLSGIQSADGFELLWAVLMLMYGLGVGAGGIIGYLRARSKVSLGFGLASGTALLLTAATSFESPPVSLLIATAIAIVLSTVFSIRWSKTRKFMPAGLLTIVSLIAIVTFFCAFLFEMRTVS
jgi:uncharacterized membrane protein (UPF0136 family)